MSGNDSQDLFPTVGQSQSVVRSLSYRIGRHSPELVLQIEEYLRRQGEGIDERVSFDGTDASAKLCFALLEALMAYEQLRLELTSQLEEKTPGRLMQAMSIGATLEPALIHIGKQSFQMHLMLWNADSLKRRPRVDLEEERISVKKRKRADKGPLASLRYEGLFSVIDEEEEGAP